MFGETFNRTTARSVGSVALAVGLLDQDPVPLAASATAARGNATGAVEPSQR